MSAPNKQPTSLLLRLPLAVRGAAFEALREQLATYAVHHRLAPVPDELLVSHHDGYYLKRLREDDRTLWEVFAAYASTLGAKMHMLPRPTVVHVYECSVKLPESSTPEAEDVAFARAWGNEDGAFNRDAAYPGEPAEYGMGGSFVPKQWPEPRGLTEATWLKRASQSQRVRVKLWSDGRREITLLPETT